MLELTVTVGLTNFCGGVELHFKLDNFVRIDAIAHAKRPK